MAQYVTQTSEEKIHCVTPMSFWRDFWTAFVLRW